MIALRLLGVLEVDLLLWCLQNCALPPLGVDGGGSVRMLAALCGVVGLKPTFGRVPHSGVLPLSWTVGMVGILAGLDAILHF